MRLNSPYDGWCCLCAVHVLVQKNENWLGFPNVCEIHTAPAPFSCSVGEATVVETEANTQSPYRRTTCMRRNENGSARVVCARIHRQANAKSSCVKKTEIFLHQCVEEFLFSRISSALQFWRFCWHLILHEHFRKIYIAHNIHRTIEIHSEWNAFFGKLARIANAKHSYRGNGTHSGIASSPPAHSSCSSTQHHHTNRAEERTHRASKVKPLDRRLFRLVTPTILNSVLPF